MFFTEKIDVSKDAAMLLNSATAAVAAILRRREDLDGAGRVHQPMAVVLGENHDNPAHALHYLLILNGLMKAGERVMMCREQRHNAVETAYKQHTKKKPTAEAAGIMRRWDDAGATALKTWLGFFGVEGANHADSTLFNFLLKRNVPTLFNDAAQRGDNLDHKDPSTANAMNKCFGTVAGYMDTLSSEGIYARNEHMVDMALRHVPVHKPRIILQQCGDMHVVGKAFTFMKQEESLAALFKARGVPVLAMPVHARRPVNHGMSEHEYFPITLPERAAIYDPFKGRGGWFNNADFQSLSEEADYTNTLLQRADLPEAMYLPRQYAFDRQTYYGDMCRWFERLTPQR